MFLFSEEKAKLLRGIISEIEVKDQVLLLVHFAILIKENLFTSKFCFLFYK